MARNTVRGFSGSRLRRLRSDRNMTADDLADRADVSTPAVWSWESGRTSPTPPALARIAAALYVAIGDLIAIPDREMLLADLRVQAGLTQAGAAQQLGMSAYRLVRIEKGRMAWADAEGQALAAAYGIPITQVEAAWHRTTATRRAYLQGL